MHSRRFIPLKRISLFLALAVVVLAFGSFRVAAQFSQELPPVEVTLDVGDTILTVQGQAPPNSFVTILESNSSIGTTSADGAGNFSKTFTAQTSGLHTISVFAKTGEVTTDTVSKTINLVAQAETTVNFFLPTTLKLSSSQVTEGSSITFSGNTIPNGEVTLTLDNNFNASVTADAGGQWSFSQDTTDMYIGTHNVFAVVSDGLGNQSFPTSQRAFQVLSKEPPAVPAHIPAPQITEPHNNQHFSESTLVVKGIALQNSQVELWDGESVVGSVFANHLGEWQIFIQLSKSTHELKARTCAGAVCSKFSSTVTIYYDGADAGKPAKTLSLRLGKYRYAFVRVNKPAILDVFYGGGTKPYELLIDWGDTNIERITLEDAGSVQLTHLYEKAGHYNGIVTLRDDKDAAVVRYFSVLVETPQGVPPEVTVTAGAVGAAAAVYIAVTKGYAGAVLRFIRKFW